MYRSKFQKEQIEKAKLMLLELSKKENKQNEDNQEKSLYDMTLYEMISTVQNDLIDILFLFSTKELDWKVKIKKLNDYKVSIGIFMVFIATCIFLSTN